MIDMVNGNALSGTLFTTGTSKLGRKLNANALWELLHKQQFKCALSGAALTPQNATIDHIVPISKGGTNEIANLQWVTKDVNAAKRNMDQEAFIDLCTAVYLRFSLKS